RCSCSSTTSRCPSTITRPSGICAWSKCSRKCPARSAATPAPMTSAASARSPPPGASKTARLSMLSRLLSRGAHSASSFRLRWILRPPIFVRTLTDDERQALEQGLRSQDAFVLRRCQILLASARGERAPRIAQYLGIDDQTVLDALHAFNATGL